VKSIISLLLLCLLFADLYAQKSAEEWQAIIDTTWGEGLPTTDKLAIFDLIWNTIDDDYACFHNLNINWDSLRTVFRAEIETGVSRGRFYGIISHLYLALQEAHTKFLDLGIYHSDLKPGIPLLVYQSGYYYNDHGHFGAGLTPLPDSSLLVYKVIENHPLGLEPGDIVLGYDGIPWKFLYKQLLAACLPITSLTEPFSSLIGLYTFGGSSDRSATHIWLMSAGLNWHLFDIIDIIKYGSNDTLHLHTSPLEELDTQLICTEQLPVPGVPMPDLSEPSTDMITWGVIDGTQIGYIYASHWAEFLGADVAFANAVDELLNDYQTEGLIIDSRLNAGGQNWAANGGFIRLFNFNAEILDFAERSDPNDHYALEETNGRCGDLLRFNADPYLYDKPIAVLTGPLTWSAGDVNAMRLKYHPMTRFFGKPTNTAYICMGYDWNFFPSYPDWFGAYAPMNAYLLDNSGDYLTHVGFDVDEEVWLTPEDVVKGEDTVVKRAIEWIHNLSHAHNVSVNKTYIGIGQDSLTITAEVENPNNHDVDVTAFISIGKDSLIDSINFTPKLNGADNLWQASYFSETEEEQTCFVDVITKDPEDSTTRKLSNVAWFTSIGPIVFDHIETTSSDTIANPGDRLKFKFALRNLGKSSTATNITALIQTTDSMTTVISESIPMEFGDISPGQIAQANKYIQFSNTNYPTDPYEAKLAIVIQSEGYTYWHDTTSVIVGLHNQTLNMPRHFALAQNYPNPFNPSTSIEFALPNNEFVELKVYNILGEVVSILISEKLNHGNHTYTFDGRNLASGIYYYQLVAGDYREVKKMILLK
jgi:hypothetical protein